jgi:hypothetical protein
MTGIAQDVLVGLCDVLASDDTLGRGRVVWFDPGCFQSLLVFVVLWLGVYPSTLQAAKQPTG